MDVFSEAGLAWQGSRENFLSLLRVLRSSPIPFRCPRAGLRAEVPSISEVITMLSTSPQSPVGSTLHRQGQWQESSCLKRAGCKGQILLACTMGAATAPVFRASSKLNGDKP